MKEFYQTYKAKTGKFKDSVVVTVCTILDEKGNLGRGVAVCSPFDEPGEEAGEWWARRYALRAIKRKPAIYITDYRAIRTILHTDCPFIMQSAINPVLTFKEQSFFYGKKKTIEMIKNSSFTNSTYSAALANSHILDLNAQMFQGVSHA